MELSRILQNGILRPFTDRDLIQLFVDIDKARRLDAGFECVDCVDVLPAACTGTGEERTPVGEDGAWLDTAVVGAPAKQDIRFCGKRTLGLLNSLDTSLRLFNPTAGTRFLS